MERRECEREREREREREKFAPIGMRYWQEKLPLYDGDSPFKFVVLNRENVVGRVRTSDVYLQGGHLDQLVAMVETRRKDIENGDTRLDELLESFWEKSRPVDGREEDGLYLIVAEFKGRLVSQDQHLA